MSRQALLTSADQPAPLAPLVDGAAPRRDAVHRHRLDETEAEQAYQLAARCLGEYGWVGNPGFLAEVGVLAHDLPRSVRLAVNAARLDDRKHGLILVGNRVDEADLGPTPLGWQPADTSASRVYAFLIMLYGSLLGDVVSWATQQDGRLVTDVVPAPGMEDSLVSSSSHTELGWHTEDAFSPYRADFVGLLCLRSPDLTATTIGHLDAEALPADLGRVLREPRFHIRPDASHDAALNSGPADVERADAFGRLEEVRRRPALIPLIDGHPQAPVLRIDGDFVTAAEGDGEAAEALVWLTEHLTASLYDFPLLPGDMGFIDNRNVVHGRRPFNPRYDGTDRWLKRINVVEDLRRTRPGRADAATRVIG